MQVLAARKPKGKKNKRKTKSKTKNVKSKDKTSIEKKEPEEIVAKMVTLANFWCDLRYVNWSDETVDFYWANHPKCSNNAIAVEGSLKVRPALLNQ